MSNFKSFQLRKKVNKDGLSLADFDFTVGVLSLKKNSMTKLTDNTEKKLTLKVSYKKKDEANEKATISTNSYTTNFSIQKQGQITAKASEKHAIVVAGKKSTKIEAIVKLDVDKAKSINAIEGLNFAKDDFNYDADKGGLSITKSFDKANLTAEIVKVTFDVETTYTKDSFATTAVVDVQVSRTAAYSDLVGTWKKDTNQFTFGDGKLSSIILGGSTFGNIAADDTV